MDFSHNSSANAEPYLYQWLLQRMKTLQQLNYTLDKNKQIKQKKPSNFYPEYENKAIIKTNIIFKR